MTKKVIPQCGIGVNECGAEYKCQRKNVQPVNAIFLIFFMPFAIPENQF